MILITTLALALAGAGVLGFTAIRRASSGHLDAAGAQAPATSEIRATSETPLPSTTPVAPMTSVEPKTPLAPAAAPEKMPVPPARAPTPARSEAANADGAVPRRGQLDAPPAHAVTPPTNRATGSSAPARDDRTSAEGGDPTAAIDWLLKSSRAKGQ